MGLNNEAAETGNWLGICWFHCWEWCVQHSSTCCLPVDLESALISTVALHISNREELILRRWRHDCQIISAASFYKMISLYQWTSTYDFWIQDCCYITVYLGFEDLANSLITETFRSLKIFPLAYWQVCLINDSSIYKYPKQHFPHTELCNNVLSIDY